VGEGTWERGQCVGMCEGKGKYFPRACDRLDALQYRDNDTTTSIISCRQTRNLHSKTVTTLSPTSQPEYAS
jgi:hypothetical protein